MISGAPCHWALTDWMQLCFRTKKKKKLSNYAKEIHFVLPKVCLKGIQWGDHVCSKKNDTSFLSVIFRFTSKYLSLGYLSILMTSSLDCVLITLGEN